jgi:hypothetical protein
MQWIAGGGVTHLVMPRLQEALAHHMPVFISWRVAYFLPGAVQVVAGLLILLLGQVLPLLPCVYANNNNNNDDDNNNYNNYNNSNNDNNYTFQS